MKYSTHQLYGNDIPEELIQERKEVLNKFKNYAKKQLTNLYKPDMWSRNEELITAVSNAIKWCDMILDEEIK